jgi:hypothetical protein
VPARAELVLVGSASKLNRRCVRDGSGASTPEWLSVRRETTNALFPQPGATAVKKLSVRFRGWKPIEGIPTERPGTLLAPLTPEGGSCRDVRGPPVTRPDPPS